MNFGIAVDWMQHNRSRLSIGRVICKINKLIQENRRRQLRRRVALTAPSPEADLKVTYSPHCLTCHQDLLMTICSAKSLNLAIDKALPWVFHDDGSLTMADKHLLLSQFPGCFLICRSEADTFFERPDLKIIGRARKKSALLLKLADLHVFARRNRILYVDSDILFFKRPDALLRAIENENGSHFTKDIKTAYIAPIEILERLTGVRPLDRINSGIFVLSRSDITLDKIVQMLPKIDREVRDDWTSYNHLVEQTLFAILATAGESGVTHLPAEYDLCLERGLREAVCRHYVGVIREFFELEGLQTLLNELDFLARWHEFVGGNGAPKR
jgi:hypothetical protein